MKAMHRKLAALYRLTALKRYSADSDLSENVALVIAAVMQIDVLANLRKASHQLPLPKSQKERRAAGIDEDLAIAMKKNNEG